jgi:hypothetical protein
MPDASPYLTLRERLLIDFCWLCGACLWVWFRRRAKHSVKVSPCDDMREPTSRAGDWLRLRLWVTWPNFLGRAMLVLLLTVAVVSSVVDLIQNLRIAF